jgi:hypothetical protein
MKQYKVTDLKQEVVITADMVLIKDGMVTFYGAMPTHEFVAAVAIAPGLMVTKI